MNTVMNEHLFQKFAKIAYDQAGVFLRPGKESLVSARVGKRLRALGLGSPKDYLTYLEADETGEEIVQFLDVITTNFTSFFREADHFELLREALKTWLDQGQRRVRIWSAASSSGQEPYSIAMTALAACEGRQVDLKILATDISTKVLRKASDGLYTSDETNGLTRQHLLRYFDKEAVEGKNGSSKGEAFRIKPSVREILAFRRLNLSKPPFPMKGPLDVVFCRNVMIYFDNEVRQRLVSECERLLKPGGLLLVGHTETLTALKTNLQAVEPSVYRVPRR